MCPKKFPVRALPDPDPDALVQLEALRHVLSKALPIPSRFQHALPVNIRKLSERLTRERGDIFGGYLADPPNLAAYLRYFLPWNLIRLSRLFTGLDLEFKDGTHIADLGAGPLTVTLALWISRPDLRKKRLEFTCLDLSPKAMSVGREVFNLLAGDEAKSWTVRTVKGGPGTKLFRRPDLYTAVNALNEMAEGPGSALHQKAERLARSLAVPLAPDGSVLLVEPGTRASARLIAAMRPALADQGLKPAAPCPHGNNCPMPGETDKPWCHFNMPATPCPEWLADLSARAKLPKRTLSLSYLLASPNPERAPGTARVVSEPFSLPDNKVGQYACTDHGLAMAVDTPTHPGTLAPIAWPPTPDTDEKSGARIGRLRGTF